MEVENGIPRDFIDPIAIINNAVFRRFKRQSVTINAVFTGYATIDVLDSFFCQRF